MTKSGNEADDEFRTPVRAASAPFLFRAQGHPRTFAKRELLLLLFTDALFIH